MSETIEEKRKFKLETSTLRAYTMLGVMVLIWLFFYWQTGGTFLKPQNISNLLLQTSVTGIIAVGMLMVIVSGNIDLSVGSLLALAGGVSAIVLANSGYGLIPSILAAIAVSTAIGLLQGALTAYLNIPSFIVTLGGLLAWRGAIKGISNSETIPVYNDWFKFFGQGYAGDAAIILNEDLELAFNWGWIIAIVIIILLLLITYRRNNLQKGNGLNEASLKTALLKTILPISVIIGFVFAMNSYEGTPIPVLIFLVVALIGFFITNNTRFGRYLYAIGGNADAARLSGINNKINIVKVFAFLGALTGIAAVIYTARVGSATPDAGTLLELDAIAACVIGGTSLMGGRGTVFGACLGALIMASLDNGMSLLNVQDYMQELVKGGILVAAVGLDMIGKKS